MLKRGLISIGLAGLFTVLLATSLTTRQVTASPQSATCDVISCTVYLPLLIKPVPAITPVFELTQGLQQPDNSVRLIAQRPSVLRWSLTASTSTTNVSAYLVATRNGETLAGSPLAAFNNPRTLKNTADRAALNDTFNFQLPTDWAADTVNLSAYATNDAGFITNTMPQAFGFSGSVALPVKVVPIEYHCASGGAGTTTPSAPYNYLVDYTFRTYPVPTITLSTHAPVAFYGRCNSSGVPLPWTNTDPNNLTYWENMLDLVTSVWQAEGSPNIYYYGLLHLDCGGGCVAGIGWLGWQAAVGFDGFGAAHSGASDTHAHEVGHNHDRPHAPGCGAGNPGSFPYLDGSGRAILGNAANPNYGFDLTSKAIYPYANYFDFMTYCDPVWISNYTYEALWQFDNSTLVARSANPIGERTLLVRGTLDARTSQVEFRPTYAIDTPARKPQPGDYTLDLLDDQARVLATYSFAMSSATPDQIGAPTAPTTLHGFNFTVPYVNGVSALRVRQGRTILGQQLATPNALTVKAAQVRSGQLSWSGTADARYLVRASRDNGRTWEIIGVDLGRPGIDLSAWPAGERIQFDIIASNGLKSQTLKVGPILLIKQ